MDDERNQLKDQLKKDQNTHKSDCRKLEFKMKETDKLNSDLEKQVQ